MDLKTLLESHNIFLSDEQINKLLILKEETLLANKSFNLTSISSEEFAIKMILDCLIFINSFKDENLSLIDVGSGAGFPGLVLAICLPNYKITCLDSTKKKCNHILYMINKLGLDNVEVVNARVETYAKSHFEKFDIAIARALKSLNILVELLTPLIKVNGQVIAMKSINFENELKDAKNGIKKLFLKLENIETYNLDDNSKRAILYFNKLKSTPKKYPRLYDQIIKRPL